MNCPNKVLGNLLFKLWIYSIHLVSKSFIKRQKRRWNAYRTHSWKGSQEMRHPLRQIQLAIPANPPLWQIWAQTGGCNKVLRAQCGAGTVQLWQFLHTNIHILGKIFERHLNAHKLWCVAWIFLTYHNN